MNDEPFQLESALQTKFKQIQGDVVFWWDLTAMNECAKLSVIQNTQQTNHNG